ncbi:MAG: PAS domain-containing sensor histidine kinase [Ferruginibacter sp.]
MSSLLNSMFSSFNYFEALFKNTKENNILLMDDTGAIIETNDAFIRSFGFTRDDIIGKSFAMLFTETDQRMNLPQKEITKVLSQGQASDNNFLVDKNKNLIWVSGESILVENTDGKSSILKIIQNINTLKISENSVISLNNFNESILSSIEDVVIVLTTDLHIIKINSAFSKLFGYAGSLTDNLNFAELIHPFDINNELYDKIRKLATTKERFYAHSLEIETAAGEKKVFDISCCIMKHSATGDNILLTAHDTTIQKQAEKEREDIIGFVAHELRNPLANIVLCNEMMTQLILEGQMNELEEYLTRSKNNVMRLNKMISELYDATKFNSGNFTLEKATFDFEEMIEEALDTLEVLHPDYSIILEGECTKPVYGDRYRLIQVVTNFLSNGIKYSNNNTRVIIHMRQEDNNVIVSVKDEGLGISPKQLPRIFGRFFRAEKTKNLEGIGLGLYLCRRIIEAHDGKVWAESEEGYGSTFYFSIPL